MSDEEVSREKGYLIISETSMGSQSVLTQVDRVGSSVRDVAKWVIDNHWYYLSHDTMQTIKEMTDTGGACTMEIEVDGRDVSLTVIKSHEPGEVIPKSQKVHILTSKEGIEKVTWDWPAALAELSRLQGLNAYKEDDDLKVASVVPDGPPSDAADEMHPF